MIMKGYKIASLPVKELVVEVDAEEEDNNYIKNKFNDRAKLADKKTRVIIKKTQLTALDMKCYYGCNHYGEREKTINAGASSDECPRFSEIETLENFAQCRNTVSMRVDFILDFYEYLKRVQVLGVTEEEPILIIEDIRNFMIENLKDFETN